MKYSIVKLQQVNNAIDRRLDPEYWDPEVLKVEQKLDGEKLSTFIQDGYRVVYENTKIIEKKIGEREHLPYFVQASDIENFYINMDTVDCVSENDWNAYPKGRINKGELLIEVKGNVKKVAIVTDDIPCKTLISGTLYKASIKNINKYHVLNFLSCKYGQKLKERLVCNIATPYINKESLYNIKIPLMSNEFQKKIEKCYIFAFKIVQKSKESYSDSLITLLSLLDVLNWTPKHKLWSVKNYSDVKDANRFDAEYFQPKYEEILKTIKDCSNGYDILGNIVSIKKGIEVGSDEYQGNEIPFVRVSNLNKFGINENNQQYISQKTYDRLALEYQPQKGEILLSKDGTAGIAYYMDETPSKMIISGGILRLTITDSEYLPEYLTLVLNSILVQQQIERTSSGALIQHWLINEINNTLIPKLDIQKQREIVGKIQESTKCRKQSKQLLEIAKRGVEIAIEQDEYIATNWINQELQKIGVEL